MRQLMAWRSALKCRSCRRARNLIRVSPLTVSGKWTPQTNRGNKGEEGGWAKSLRPQHQKNERMKAIFQWRQTSAATAQLRSESSNCLTHSSDNPAFTLSGADQQHIWDSWGQIEGTAKNVENFDDLERPKFYVDSQDIYDMIVCSIEWCHKEAKFSYSFSVIVADCINYRHCSVSVLVCAKIRLLCVHWMCVDRPGQKVVLPPKIMIFQFRLYSRCRARTNSNKIIRTEEGMMYPLRQRIRCSLISIPVCRGYAISTLCDADPSLSLRDRSIQNAMFWRLKACDIIR